MGAQSREGALITNKRIWENIKIKLKDFFFNNLNKRSFEARALSSRSFTVISYKMFAARDN